MAHAVHETIYDVDASQLYRAVTDYEKYPEFVDGMKKVTVDRSQSQPIVHYDLSMMGKDMSYTLNLQEEPEKGHLSWSLHQSAFFKINNGDWLIQALGPGKCKARYFSEVEFTFPVPGMVLKPMVSKAVPKMMESFYRRAKTLPMMEEMKTSVSSEPVRDPEPEPELEPEILEIKQDSTSKSRYQNMNDHNDSGIFSWAKKIMTVGVGTFFLTDESLKSMISEFKLPKEMMATILEGAKNVRQEFMQNVVHEVMGKVGEKMDPAAVLAEFMKKNEVTFEIKIKVKDKTNTSNETV
jgi:coenzyme Q-binding protein COQ10